MTLDIMQSTDPQPQPQPETKPNIISSSQLPNDGNLSMLPLFANTDALSSSRNRQLPLDIMQSTDPHSQPQLETMPDILPSQVPNDGNPSMLPSLANTDSLPPQLPIACQPLTPSTDPLSELSRLTKGGTDKLRL
jgi:hypothetical protein